MALVILQSGERIERETWEEIEEEIRSRQFQIYPSQDAWRKDMCYRALYFEGEELDDWGSSLSFLWELTRVGWLNISMQPRNKWRPNNETGTGTNS